MHSAAAISLLALMATTALAAPMPEAKPLAKRSFAVAHPGRPLLPASDALAKAYNKYGFQLNTVQLTTVDTTVDTTSTTSTVSAPQIDTASTDASTGSGENGEVTATPVQNDSAYVATVTIGGQEIALDFDTGSSDLWVFSTELGAAGAGHTLFNPNESSTFVEYEGATWSTHYGDGSSASGNVGFDTVSIGGATVQNQCVELAQVTNGFSSLTESNGLLGLAFSNLNQVQPQQQKTFWENILPDLDQPVFTADLDETATGSYEFGTIDSTKYVGEINYAPVDSSKGYWMIASNTFTVGDTQHGCSLCNPAVVDTGTSLLLVDEDVAVTYYSAVEGAQYDQSTGLFSYPCSTQLPNLGLAIGDGYTAVLNGTQLTYLQEGDQCMGGVQIGASQQGQFQIFGDVLFRQFFVVFDGGNTQVGVAPKA